MAKKNYFIVNIFAGEEILTQWASELCKQSAEAIQRRVRRIRPDFSYPTEYGDPVGYVDVSEGEIERTRSKKARDPFGHRIAYYVEVDAYGESHADLVKLLKKARDAGKF